MNRSSHCVTFFLYYCISSVLILVVSSFQITTVPANSNPKHFNLQQQHSCHVLAATTNTIQSNDSSQDEDDDNKKYHSLTLFYEGRSCEVLVDSDETILTALERTGVSKHLGLTSSELPSDCRRGNCMTCAARHVENSKQSSLKRLEDGLSPYISKEVHKRGYVLTCSSHVVGDGVKIEIGKNHQAWTDIYSIRMQDEDIQLVGRAAMAKTRRKYDERHYNEWEKETKKMLKEPSGKEQNE